MTKIVDLLVDGEKQFPYTHFQAIERLVDFCFPVGSVIDNQLEDFDPNEMYPGSVWERYAKGKVPVGVNEEDPDFDTAGKTGGEKTHKLTESEMPSHVHDTGLFRGSNPPGTGGTGGYTWGERGATTGNKLTIATGGNQAHNNLQPYIAVYMWVRTA